MTEFNLSEKECNILTEKIDNLKRETKIKYNKDNTKVIITEPIEIMFEKGYFKEDIKEFIKELKEKGFTLSQERGQTGDMKMILISEEDLDKLAGSKLK